MTNLAAEYAKRLLKEYSESEGHTIRSTSDLSRLEEWLMKKSFQKSSPTLPFNFWLRLKNFVDNVMASDAAGEEEKQMILHVAEEKIKTNDAVEGYKISLDFIKNVKEGLPELKEGHNCSDTLLIWLKGKKDPVFGFYYKQGEEDLWREMYSSHIYETKQITAYCNPKHILPDGY